MKRLPFDLKAALAGAKVVTRSGLPVTDLTFKKSIFFPTKWPVKGILHRPNGIICELTWSTEGYWLSGPDSEENLFMAGKPAKKIIYWVNFYRESGLAGDCAYGFKTRAQADQAGCEGRIGGKARKVVLEVAE